MWASPWRRISSWAEGLNEAGLSAGLFYFPGYGQYVPFEEQSADRSIADLQLVPWLLGNCATVEEAMAAIKEIRVVALDPRASTVHWRIADKSGRQVVLEIVGGEPRFYENELGVLTNSPGFEWQTTNLNNYVNLMAGSASTHKFGRVQLGSVRGGQRFPRPAGRRDAAFALRACRLLSDDSSAVPDRRRDRGGVLPDSQ